VDFRGKEAEFEERVGHALLFARDFRRDGANVEGVALERLFDRIARLADETTSRPELIMVSIVLFASLGKATDALLEALSRRLLRWETC
jgi:hypothetical protein